MEVPVVKIREGEAGAEEKMMIKSIVNMVQYSVCLCVWLSDTLMGTWGSAAWVLIHPIVVHGQITDGECDLWGNI